MAGQCFEVVVYKVGEAAAADSEREMARQRIATFPGFVSWMPLSGIEDASERVDLVAWSSLEAAMAAGERVGTAPEFAAFRSTIRSVTAMGHYASNAVA